MDYDFVYDVEDFVKVLVHVSLEPAVILWHFCPLVFHFVGAFVVGVDGESFYEAVCEDLFEGFHVIPLGCVGGRL